MNPAPPVPAPPPHVHKLTIKFSRGRIIVYLIAVFKLLKGCLMILTAVAAIALTRPDVFQNLRDWANDLDVGPFRSLLGQWVGTHILGLSDKTLATIAVGAAMYATLFFTEGLGLLFDRPWAEWMVVFTTAGLIPFEIIEIVRHHRPLMFVMFAGNIAIVIYLIHRVRQRMHLHATIKSYSAPTPNPTQGQPSANSPTT